MPAHSQRGEINSGFQKHCRATIGYKSMIHFKITRGIWQLPTHGLDWGGGSDFYPNLVIISIRRSTCTLKGCLKIMSHKT
jgi:hypothetical protein